MRGVVAIAVFSVCAMLAAPSPAFAQVMPDSVRNAGVTVAQWQQVQAEVRRAAAARGASERALAAVAERMSANLVVNGRVNLNQVLATIDTRAQELVELRAQLTAMQRADDPAIAAILAQATAAYDAGDLVRFDALLGQAAESDLAGIERDRARLAQRQMRAANTIEQRARLAGWGNDHLAAAALYGQAAAAIADADPERRRAYLALQAEKLMLRGAEHGDAQHLREAVRVYRDIIPLTAGDADRRTWAYSQRALGLALMVLANGGDTQALPEAIAALGASLEYYTPETSVIHYRNVQVNLGNALQMLGERTGDAQALRDAIAAYNAARHGLRYNDYARMQQVSLDIHVGETSYALARRTGDEAMLNQAKQTLRQAIPRLDNMRRTSDWVDAQSNLGGALLKLAQDGDQHAAPEAVAAYRAVLERRTREREPVAWANAQGNLGLALELLGSRGDQQALSDAVVALRAALEVLTRANAPRHWASLQYSLASVLKQQAQTRRGGRAALLEEARTAARAAVAGYQDARDTQQAARAQRLITELEALQ